VECNLYLNNRFYREIGNYIGNENNYFKLINFTKITLGLKENRGILMFYHIQSEENKNEYKELLKVVGSLSNLFAETPVPYLYYRAAENIFCRAFNADNLSRGDVSVDAAKNGLGIGLKTFLHKNGNTFQKVAEFNRGAVGYQGQDPRDIVENISKQRNERINFTMRAHDLNNIIYHLVTREEGQFNIFEENMDLVDLNSLRDIKQRGNIIHFRDNLHEYKFNLSKSTLEKRFVASTPLHQFYVDILEDPYSFLLERSGADIEIIREPEETHEHIYLPLYSPDSGEVQRGSGLNQWNAGGRSRNEDELYIPIPIWIHRTFSDFFQYDLEAYQEARRNRRRYESPTFTLELPNGTTFPAKICQENGKALMTNPNRALGNWMLRRVLQIPPGILATYDMLENVGVDSVKVTKISEDYFRIDFSSLGSFADFEEEFKN
jgi:hypothetical protein